MRTIAILIAIAYTHQLNLKEIQQVSLIHKPTQFVCFIFWIIYSFFKATCDLKEQPGALNAIRRAISDDCKLEIANFACQPPLTKQFSRKCSKSIFAETVTSPDKSYTRKNSAQIQHEIINNLGNLPRIVFLFTVNGRAIRQILRVLKMIYRKNHFYYFHVDEVGKIHWNFLGSWIHFFKIISFEENALFKKGIKKVRLLRKCPCVELVYGNNVGRSISATNAFEGVWRIAVDEDKWHVELGLCS